MTADDDDARSTSLWYTGTFPVDVYDDLVDETIDVVQIDPNSDGLFTVIEIDGDDSGGYSAAEVHDAAGASWPVEKSMDTEGQIGPYTSIAAVDKDTLFISYYDATGANLKVAKSTDAGATWPAAGIETPDSSGDVGQYSSIVAVEDTDGDDNYSAPVTVASTDDVGRYASLAAEEETIAFITFYDATNGDLKSVTSVDGGASWDSTRYRGLRWRCGTAFGRSHGRTHRRLCQLLRRRRPG